MKSQNATATLGNITSCPGENVLVPIDVTGFFEVGAMTFYIGYDTNAAEFLSIQNINPAIPSWISANASGGQVGIAYSSLTPFDLDGEKLFDLSFSYLSDSTVLNFLPGTEIANSNLEIIPLDTFPGGIFNSIQLIDQPDSVQSYPDNDVIFRVTSLGNPDYQWQENTGSGWNNLQNNGSYSGVTTDTLYIYDVTLDFNGNAYRCVITADECTVISDIALLEVADAYPVASLGHISSCPDNEILEPLFVGDFFDVIEFTFNISYNTNALTFLNLENIHPDLLAGTMAISPLVNPPGIIIHWEDANPVSITSGTLFDLSFTYESGSQAFSFETGSVVLNSFSNPVDITLNDGAVEQFATPLIITQPQDETVMEFENAGFNVEADGADNYRWMISTDHGNSWTDLTNTPPYFNTGTPSLTINPATYNMDEDQFMCRLSNAECLVLSEPAILSVDTLTYIGDAVEEILFKVHPVPFRDNIFIDLPAGSAVSLISVYNSQGQMLYSIEPDAGRNYCETYLDLSDLQEGLYILKASGIVNGRTVFEQKKILKIN